MIAGDVGDDRDFFADKVFQPAVKDQIHAVLVMAFAGDVPADVVEHCGIVDQLALFSGELVQRLRLIKQIDAQFRNMLAVRLMPGASTGQVEDASAARVGDFPPDRKFRADAGPDIRSESLRARPTCTP